MKLKIFGIYDVKADAFARPPFFLSTIGQATRAFGDLALDKNTDVGMHPEDYKLMCLGVFDNESGKVEGFGNPESIGFAIEFIPKKE